MTAARKLHGDLADDIELLASDGKVIRRHDGMYRLNGATEKLTAAMVRGLAAEVRNRRTTAAIAPQTQCGHEITSERGKGRPPGGRAGTPVEGRAGSSPAAPTCTKCGGPMSKWSKGQCAVCYAQAGRGSYPQRPYAERPDKFWRAVQRDAAPSGRVDAGPHTDVPPAATPQTASGPPTAAVTPAPESGASAGTHRPSAPWKAPAKVCEKCGGPRSYWSAACCLKCHRTAMSAPRVTQENRIQALERKVAALEALMSMEGLR